MLLKYYFYKPFNCNYFSSIQYRVPIQYTIKDLTDYLKQKWFNQFEERVQLKCFPDQNNWNRESLGDMRLNQNWQSEIFDNIINYENELYTTETPLSDYFMLLDVYTGYDNPQDFVLNLYYQITILGESAKEKPSTSTKQIQILSLNGHNNNTANDDLRKMDSNSYRFKQTDLAGLPNEKKKDKQKEKLAQKRDKGAGRTTLHQTSAAVAGDSSMRELGIENKAKIFNENRGESDSILYPANPFENLSQYFNKLGGGPFDDQTSLFEDYKQRNSDNSNEFPMIIVNQPNDAMNKKLQPQPKIVQKQSKKQIQQNPLDSLTHVSNNIENTNQAYKDLILNSQNDLFHYEGFSRFPQNHINFQNSLMIESNKYNHNNNNISLNKPIVKNNANYNNNNNINNNNPLLHSNNNNLNSTTNNNNNNNNSIGFSNNQFSLNIFSQSKINLNSNNFLNLNAQQNSINHAEIPSEENLQILNINSIIKDQNNQKFSNIIINNSNNRESLDRFSPKSHILVLNQPTENIAIKQQKKDLKFQKTQSETGDEVKFQDKEKITIQNENLKPQTKNDDQNLGLPEEDHFSKNASVANTENFENTKNNLQTSNDKEESRSSVVQNLSKTPIVSPILVSSRDHLQKIQQFVNLAGESNKFPEPQLSNQPIQSINITRKQN